MHQNILVILERSNIESPALRKALLLAEKFNAKLHMVAFCYDTEIDNPLLFLAADAKRQRARIVQDRQEYLDNQLEKLADSNVEISGEVVWERSILEWVLHRGEFDLVVKTATNSGSLFHTSTDWDFLRHFDRPFLLVNAEKPGIEHNKLLLCLDLLSSDAQHQALNKQLIAMGEKWCASTQGQAHFVTAIPRRAVLVNDVTSQVSPIEFEKSLMKIARENYAALCEGTSFSEAHLHILHGNPRDVISPFAEEKGFGPLVIATLGRSKMKGLLIGNTAEKLMSKTCVDFITIRAKS